MSIQIAVILVVIGSSLWVLNDSARIGVRRGLIKGNCDYGPGGWFAICLLFWIVGFPCYLNMRQRYIDAASRVSRPPSDLVGTVECPFCQACLPQDSLRIGANTCKSCSGVFNVASGG